MTPPSNTALLRNAHADWLRHKAAHVRFLAGGAIPFAVAEDLRSLAVRYERLAAALDDAVRLDAAADAAD